MRNQDFNPRTKEGRRVILNEKHDKIVAEKGFNCQEAIQIRIKLSNL